MSASNKHPVGSESTGAPATQGQKFTAIAAALEVYGLAAR
jgi:hypothetical protein